MLEEKKTETQHARDAGWALNRKPLKSKTVDAIRKKTVARKSLEWREFAISTAHSCAIINFMHKWGISNANKCNFIINWFPSEWLWNASARESNAIKLEGKWMDELAP